MKMAKKIGLWIVVGLLAIIALGAIPSFATIFAIVLALIIMPIEKLQSIFKNFLKGKLKIIIIVILVILTFITLPTSSSTNDNNSPNGTIPTDHSETIKHPTDSSTNPTTAIATTPNTLPVTPSATQATTPTTTPATQPTTPPATTPATQPTTPPTTTPTTQPTTPPATTPATQPTTPPTTPPHVHKFSAATCTAPKTCSCGATEGQANGHEWKDATYTTPKTCETCGITSGNPLDVPGKENYHGHVYTGGQYSKKYHYEENCAGKNSHEITWEEVEKRNLGPCSTCVLN